MAVLRVRNLILGAGAPKLFAPIVGADAEGTLTQAAALGGLGAEAAEWRFDACGAALWPGGADLWQKLRAALEDMPLLFTYRTAAELAGEGGCPADYIPILRWALNSSGPDMIDIELARGEKPARELAAEAKRAGVASLLSKHDFCQTPPERDMVELLLTMEDAGAAAAKLAVTPQGPADVLAIFSAMEAARERLSIPFAILGMGDLGPITRLGGGVFGAAFTFGAGVAQSAPGQPPIPALRAAFDLLYKA